MVHVVAVVMMMVLDHHTTLFINVLDNSRLVIRRAARAVQVMVMVPGTGHICHGRGDNEN